MLKLHKCMNEVYLICINIYSIYLKECSSSPNL